MTIPATRGEGFTGLPNLPALDEIRQLPRWVVWKYVPRENGGKPTKVPYMPGAGFKASVGRPSHWSTYVVAERAAIQRGFAGVGIVLVEDDDLFAIDLDNCITDGAVAPWADEILAMAETYAEVTPSGTGLRLFGRGHPPTIGADSVGVEIYSGGRYVTVTGWHFPGTPDTIHAAPRSVERLSARVEALKPVLSTPTAAPSYDRDCQRSIEELDELIHWIPASCGYHEWLAVLMALHRETGGSAEGLDLADRWSATGGIAYAGRREIEAKWRSFRRDGVTGASIAELARQHGANLSEISARHRPAPPNDGFDPDKLVVGKGVHSVQAPPPAPTSLPYPDGLVGEIARWIVACSSKPQPELAIGAALAVVGTAAGRQYVGPTRTGTALYLLGLAPTGQGKDRPLKQIRILMKAAGLGHHVGPDGFMSYTSVINVLKRSLVTVCPMDEFGAFLAGVYDRRGSTHAKAIPRVLRTVWSANFDEVATPEWASVESMTLSAPHLALFGVSTHEQFYRALEGGAVADGTLNRFVVLEGAEKPDNVEPSANPEQPPAGIVAQVRAIYLASGEMAAACRGTSAESPTAHEGHCVRLSWADHAARSAWEAFRDEMEARGRKRPREAELVVRAAEIAIRAATIVAAGRGDVVVTVNDVRFGVDFARRSVDVMMAGAEEYMAENETEANWQRVRRFIRDNSVGPVSFTNEREEHVELDAAVPYGAIQAKVRDIRARDLRELLDAMVEAGEIRFDKEKRPGGRWPVRWYWTAR